MVENIFEGTTETAFTYSIARKCQSMENQSTEVMHSVSVTDVFHLCETLVTLLSTVNALTQHLHLEINQKTEFFFYVLNVGEKRLRALVSLLFLY